MEMEASETDALYHQKREARKTHVQFALVLLSSQLLGLLAIALVAVWMSRFSGGFAAWRDNPAIEFNYHPLFMTVGLIFLYGEAIVIYRVLRRLRKSIAKTIHVVLHSVIFVLVVIALVAVFDSHNLAPKPFPNMYSAHSWLGLTTVLAFCLQYVGGFVSFLFPRLPQAMRDWYMPAHRVFGLAIFVLAVGAALMGITEKAIFNKVSPFAPENMVINCLCVAIVLFAFCVAFIVRNPRFERRRDEEEPLRQRTD